MRSTIALLVAAVSLCSCNPRRVIAPCNRAGPIQPKLLPQTLNNKADILFMIDNSASMDPMQESLRQYFPNFMQPLKDLDTKPDLHIGIITSDLGAGPGTPPSCDTVGGDQGILQNTPNGSTCAAASLTSPSDRFLRYAEINGQLQTNFSGDIADAFACYATVGAGGCGFEHQLASVRRALDGTQQANTGFLRPEAYLAVILLTNEDDCSAPSNSTLFDASQTTLQSPLGPLTSYRCFEFGNLCNGAPPGRNQGPRTGCEPGSWDTDPRHQLTPVEEFADFLMGLKQDPSMLYVSIIGAPPEPVQVGVDPSGYPDLQPSCTGGMGSGDPAPRLSKFVGLFDRERSSYISICAQDLRLALEQIANELGRMIDKSCLSMPLADQDPDAADLQPECVVEDRMVVDAAAGTYDYAAVPRCDPPLCDPATAPGGDCKCARHEIPAGAPGCWYVWADAACDTDGGPGYQLKIDRGIDASCVNPSAPLGTDALVQCMSCFPGDCSPPCIHHWPDLCPEGAATSVCE